MPAVPALTDAERCALWEFAEDIAEAGVSRVLVTPVDPSSLPADEA